MHAYASYLPLERCGMESWCARRLKDVGSASSNTRSWKVQWWFGRKKKRPPGLVEKKKKKRLAVVEALKGSEFRRSFQLMLSCSHAYLSHSTLSITLSRHTSNDSSIQHNRFLAFAPYNCRLIRLYTDS